MLNKLNVIIIFSLMMLLVLPFSFAADNVSSDDFTISIIDNDVLKDTNNYYFNASAADDGNGGVQRLAKAKISNYYIKAGDYYERF